MVSGEGTLWIDSLLLLQRVDDPLLLRVLFFPASTTFFLLCIVLFSIPLLTIVSFQWTTSQLSRWMVAAKSRRTKAGLAFHGGILLQLYTRRYYRVVFE
jgi:hypothetical protein